MRFRTFFARLAASALLLAGCAAPHDNPLDPASDHYRPGNTPTPVALQARVRLERIARNFPTTPTYTVFAEVLGEDAGQQDSVWVSYAGREARTLSREAPGLPWATNYSSSYFDDPADPSDPPLASVPGMPFHFGSRDLDGREYALGPAYLIRVIYTAPQIAEPDSLHTVGPWPTLSWSPFTADFRPYFYQAAVIVDVGQFDRLVWESPLLSDTATSIRMPDSLADGQYYWTITVLDTFENSSRSREGDFVVSASGP